MKQRARKAGSTKSQAARQPQPKKRRSMKPRRVSAQLVAGVLAFALLAGGSFAHWRVTDSEAKPVAKKQAASSAPARDAAAAIPEESGAPEPPPFEPPMVYPTMAGYNASSGMLPPGALPPGVMIPGAPPVAPQPGMYPAAMSPMGMMAQGGRTTAQGYGVYDGVRQQFTGKERDGETGLDYFGARYYSSQQGRFTSVDPENAGADPSDPQSWNGYSYALNNPLKYQDPDGRKVLVCDGAGKNCHEINDDEAKYGLFNKEWQKHIGYTVKNNKIWDESGNLVGTYRRTSFDDLDARANAVIFGTQGSAGLVDRAPAAGNTALLLAGGSYVAGGLAGVPLYAATSSAALAAAEGAFANRIGYLSIQQLNNLIRGTQKEALGKLFGNGVQGARQALNNLRVPPELTRQSLLVYRELARRAIEAGKPAATQIERLKVIEKALEVVK